MQRHPVGIDQKVYAYTLTMVRVREKNGSAKFSKDRNKIAALKGHRYRRGVPEPRDDGFLPCACD